MPETGPDLPDVGVVDRIVTDLFMVDERLPSKVSRRLEPIAFGHEDTVFGSWAVFDGLRVAMDRAGDRWLACVPVQPSVGWYRDHTEDEPIRLFRTPVALDDFVHGMRSSPLRAGLATVVVLFGSSMRWALWAEYDVLVVWFADCPDLIEVEDPFSTGEVLEWIERLAGYGADPAWVAPWASEFPANYGLADGVCRRPHR